jgi:RNA polymerase primary sigma factor
VTEQEKEQIQQELLEGNLRFVITVSKQYQNQGLDLSDLIAEGNYGLMKAIENFDWTKGLRFISYAVWWVRQSILQSLNENARTIRLPVNVVQELHRAKKELDSAGVDLPEKFATLPYTINLDNPLNEEGDTLLDILNNPNAELADVNLSTEDTLKKKLLEMLDVLDNRERVIIEDYFGLTGNTRTLEDIGGDFSLTKERVRQIKEKALRKLRNETSSLFDYM